MRRNTFFLVTACIAAAVALIPASCKKNPAEPPPDSPIEQGEIKVEKTYVKTYEIVSMHVPGILEERYEGTFGTATIQLFRTSDSTLSFYVPDIAPGEASLKFAANLVNFHVTPTTVNNPDEIIDGVMHTFDQRVKVLSSSSPGANAELDSMIQFKKAVLDLYHSLSAEDKKHTALFYEANKDLYVSSVNAVYNRLNASITYSTQQSDCPKINVKQYFDCTAENLGYAAEDLKKASREFVKMFGMAGIMAGTALKMSALGPPALGISMVGITLPLAAAGYILLTELIPACKHLYHAATPFLHARWIFGKSLFLSTAEVFRDEIRTSLNLTPTFRTIEETDQGIGQGTDFFIKAMGSLKEYWLKLTSIIGSPPSFISEEDLTDLTTNEVIISRISNPSVQYLGNEGQAVKFKSLSGKDERFTYHIQVNKEGFTEEKILQGKVIAAMDSISLYEAAVVGTWTVQAAPNEGGRTYQLTLSPDGNGTYHVGQGLTYPVIWYIQKNNGRYFLREYGFLHPGYEDMRSFDVSLPDNYLTYPVTSFKTYNGITRKLTITYTKN